MMPTNPTFRIELADHLLPVQAFFNCWPNEQILSIVQQILNGVEGVPESMLLWEYNGVGCALPGYDHDDEIIDGGMMFFLPFEKKWIPNSEVRKYLESAVAAHVKFHPGDEKLGEGLIRRAKDILV